MSNPFHATDLFLYPLKKLIFFGIRFKGVILFITEVAFQRLYGIAALKHFVNSKGKKAFDCVLLKIPRNFSHRFSKHLRLATCFIS